MRTVILAGHYGSGKTTIALSLALAEKKRGIAVSVIDLDIINPYFRLADGAALLEAADIPYLAPLYANTNLDMPSLRPEIAGQLETHPGLLIIDVGGDEVGAVALGRYKALLDARGYALWLVWNPYRPFTGTAEASCAMIRQIEEASRLAFTGIVANPNLASDTDADVVRRGMQEAQVLAGAAGLPVVRAAVREDLCAALAPELPFTPLPVFVFRKPGWEIWETAREIKTDQSGGQPPEKGQGDINNGNENDHQ